MAADRAGTGVGMERVDQFGSGRAAGRLSPAATRGLAGRASTAIEKHDPGTAGRTAGLTGLNRLVSGSDATDREDVRISVEQPPGRARATQR